MNSSHGGEASRMVKPSPSSKNATACLCAELVGSLDSESHSPYLSFRGLGVPVICVGRRLPISWGTDGRILHSTVQVPIVWVS